MPDGMMGAAELRIQGEVLKSMAHYRWWEPYGGRAPKPLLTSFRQVKRLGVGVYSQPLYYGLGAAILRVAQPVSLEVAYWRLRILSLALGIATLVLAWAGTQLLFGSTIATGATTIAALHPQFLLAAISVNSDALLTCLGAVMWWLVARLVKGYRPALSVALILAVAVGALMTKRSAIPLAAVASAIAIGLLLTPGLWRISVRTVARLLSLLVVGAALVVGVWTMFEGPFRELGIFWRTAVNIRRPLDGMLLSGAIEYAQLSIDYVWLVAGWLRFSAPEAWLWVARTLTVVGFAGAAVALIRSPGLRRPLAIAWLFVIVQVAVVVGWGFFTLSSPQGRYLFPVIAPATALLWLGLTQATPERFRPYAAPVLIAILAVLDVTGFTSVLIPAYLPWG